VILDEAHYCKTPSSKRTKAALKLAAGAKWAWLLSGTPMPNDPRELYPVFKALWPRYCEEHGVTTAFKWMDRYCSWTESDYGYRVWGTKPACRTELLPALRQIMLRRRLEDVALELPPLRTTVQYLDPDPGMAQELAELGADMVGEEHMSRMRRFLGTYKASRIGKIINDELEQGQYDGVVVLYHHHDTRDTLAALLAGHQVHGFDGSTTSPMRQVEIERFQHAGGVFLAQQGAAGVGITLTRASEIVLVEPSWSPEDNNQAIKRIHRIGQDKPCRARLFAVPDSLDEGLMNALARKSAMVKEVVDADQV
jgi:SWI/SNF-related matrix-associated actin-dependent regulator 1 of chromatin subfamily A